LTDFVAAHVLKSASGIKLRFYFDVSSNFTTELEGQFLAMQRGIQEGLARYVGSVGSMYFGQKVDLFGRH